MVRLAQFSVTSVLLLLFSLNVSAFESGIEFSADAIQIAPGRASIQSKMYVGKNAVRTEMTKQGQHIVKIVYPKEGRSLLVFPQEKKYREQTGLAVAPSWADKSAKTPCEGMPKSSCHKLGFETIHNMYVEKWQVERTVKGKKYRSLHWIDSNRKLAIKEMLPDGSVSELIMSGKGKLDGRDVENWESRYSHPSGYKTTSKQWYDLELKIVIREERDDGFIRELTNIKVHKQDRNLFKLPPDYKKVTASDNNIKNFNKQ